MAKTIKKRGRRLLSALLVGIALIVTFFMLVLTPPVQTYIAQQATKWLNTNYGLNISIGKVAIKPLQRVNLRTVLWKDHHNDTLLFAKEIGVKTLFFKQDSLKLTLKASAVSLNQPVFKLRKYEGDSISNLLIALQPFFSNDVDSTPSKDFELFCKQVAVSNGSFYWNNDYVSAVKSGIDWDHIGVQKLNARFQEVYLLNDSVNAFIEYFGLYEQSGFRVDTLSGQAVYSNTVTKIEPIFLQTPYTQLSGRVKLSYDSVSDYSAFIQRVYMKGVFDSSWVNGKDIAFFASDLDGLEEEVQLDAKFRGTVDNLKLRSATIGFGNSSFLSGNFDIDGLPDVESMFINARIDGLKTNYSDLKSLPNYPFNEVNTLPIPAFIADAGEMDFSGDFTGFINDFVAYGKLNSNFGGISTDIKLRQEKEGIAYRGRVQTHNFKLNKVSGSNSLGKLNAELKVDGIGFTLDEMVADFTGRIADIEIQNYQYKDIQIDGGLIHGDFKGAFEIDDPNINLAFDGALALLDSVPEYKFNAQINRFNPVALNLMPNDTDLIIAANVEFNFQGNSLDEIVGRIDIDSLTIQEADIQGDWQQVNFLAISSGSEKTLSLKTPDFDATLTGSLALTNLSQGITHLLQTVAPSAFSEPIEPIKKHGNLNLSVDWRKTSTLSKILIPGLEKLENTTIDLTYESALDSIQLQVDAQEMNFYNIPLDSLQLVAAVSGGKGNLEFFIADAHVIDSTNIQNVQFSSIIEPDNFKNTLEFHNFSQPDYSANLNFDWMLHAPHLHQVSIHTSDLIISDTLWQIEKESSIILDSGSIGFQNFRIYSRSQALYLQGTPAGMNDEKLEIGAENFLLENVNPFIAKSGIEIFGVLNGNGFVQKPDERLFFGSNLRATNLKLNNYEIGTADFITNWNPNEKRLEVNAKIADERVKQLQLVGDYYPFKPDSNLTLGLEFSNFNLKVLNVFLSDYVNFVRGRLNGKLDVLGKVDEPKVTGTLELDSVITGVNYLNTYYAIPNGEIFIDEDLIGADYLQIIDQDLRKSYANLSIFHDNFQDFSYDIWVYAEEGIRGLQTKKGSNEYFYGSAVLEKGSSITLETADQGIMHLLVEASTTPESEIYIPLSEGTTVASSDFVHFVNQKQEQDSANLAERRLKDKGNFAMDFEMSLNKETLVKLIIDPVMGDAIDAYGSGEVSLEIDEKNNFMIYGTYELEKGDYTFTLENIINKKFGITSGSTISWDGDPYEGIADITAQYRSRTSLYNLHLPTLTTDSAELTRKVNVDLNMHLSGNYMNPEITFTFSLPSQYAEIETVLNSLEEGEKNKQVFGLLLLGQFLPVNAGDGSGTGINNAFGKSTSEMLSNQLSGWLSQISDDFDLGVNYIPGDELTADEVEVMMSTQLWNNRLTLETQVGVQGGNPGVAESTGQIVGDFMLEYKISEDGRVRGKAFNRSNTYNPIYANQSPYTQGAGISYQENFSSFSHLTCRIKTRFMSKEKRKNVDCDELERNRLLEKQHVKAAKKGVMLKD